MTTNEAGYQPRSLRPLIRWAAFTGIALLVMRRFLYATFPNLLPSSAWRRENWMAGLLASAAFDFIVLLLLTGVPLGIYYFGLRRGNTSARDLFIDCAAATGLFLATVLVL